MSSFDRDLAATINKLGMTSLGTGNTAAPPMEFEADLAETIAVDLGGKKFKGLDFTQPAIREIHAEAARLIGKPGEIEKAREYIASVGGKPKKLSDYEALVGSITQQRYPNGTMQDMEPQPVTGAAAFGVQALRGTVGPIAGTIGGTLSGISPRVQPVADFFGGMDEALPQATGGGALAGDIAGVAGQLGMMALTGGMGAAASVGRAGTLAGTMASYGLNTASESLENNELGGDVAGGLYASGRAAAEIVPEFLALEKFVIPISRGIVTRASARMAEQGVGKAATRLTADLATMGAVEGTEELTTLLANLTMDVAKGDLTLDQAARGFLREAPRTFGVAFAGTALAGGAGAVGGGAYGRIKDRASQKPQQGASSTAAPTQDAAEEPTPASVAGSAGRAEAQPTGRRVVGPSFVSEEDLADLKPGKRIKTDLPLPDLIVAEIPMFWDPADAEKLAEFRNARMVPGDDPVQVIQVMPEGQSEPYYAVRAIRPVPQEALAEAGTPEQARMNELAELNAHTARVQRFVNQARARAVRADRADGRSALDEFRQRAATEGKTASAERAQQTKPATRPQSGERSTSPEGSRGEPSSTPSSGVRSPQATGDGGVEQGRGPQPEQAIDSSSTNDTDYPSYYGDLVVAPSVRPFEGQLPNDEWRGDAIMDWYSAQLDALAKDNPPEPDFTRAHEGLNAVRELLSEGDTEGASRMWEELTYQGPALFDVSRVSPETIQAMREESEQDPIQVGDLVSMGGEGGSPRIQGTVKKIKTSEATIDLGSSGLRKVQVPLSQVKLVRGGQAEPAQSDSGTPASRSASSEAGPDRMKSPGTKVSDRTQPESSQASTKAAPSDGVTTRKSARSYTSGADLTAEEEAILASFQTEASDQVPLGSPAQKGPKDRVFLRLHAGSTQGEVYADAKAAASELKELLGKLAAKFQTSGTASRLKKLPSLKRKVEKFKLKRDLATFSDILGGRLAIDDPADIGRIVDWLNENGYTVLDDENFLDNPKPQNNGYRARHVQVKINDRTSAEIELIPTTVYRALPLSHVLFEITRDNEYAGRAEAEPEISARIDKHREDSKAVFESAWEAANTDDALDWIPPDPTPIIDDLTATELDIVAGPRAEVFAEAETDEERRAALIRHIVEEYEHLGARPRKAGSDDRAADAGGQDGVPTLAGRDAPDAGEAGARGERGGSPGVDRGPGGEDANAAGVVGDEPGRGVSDRLAGDHPRRPQSRPSPGTGGVGVNYRITTDDKIGVGGAKTKFRANIEAILTLKAVEAENRLANTDEQRILARYIGWGPLKQVFSTRGEDHKGWAKEIAEAREVLTPEEHQAASASVTNAHFTSESVVKGMWEGLARAKFKGGTVLESASGIGYFFGLMPDEIAASSRLKAVEMDSISARITRQLYQNADVVNAPLQAVNLAPNSIDLAITNVPFAKTTVTDEHDLDLTRRNLTLHNYFIAKNLKALRPGGLGVFITTHFTLDSLDRSHRTLFDSLADLVGVIRLNNRAFSGNAATPVVTDVLIFQKRMPGAASRSMPFLESRKVSFRDSSGTVGEARLNKVFADQVQGNDYPGVQALVIGKHSFQGSMRRENEYTVDAADEKAQDRSVQADLRKQIAGYIAQVAAIDKEALEASRSTPEAEGAVVGSRSDLDAAGVKENALTVRDGQVYQRKGDTLIPVPLPGGVKDPAAHAERIEAVIQIRETFDELLAIEVDPEATDAQVEAVRKRLNKVYDKAMKLKPGGKGTAIKALNNVYNNRFFWEDPDWPRLLSLEHWDEDSKTAKKADIFTTRLQRPKKTITHVDSAQAALRESLNQRGGVDMEFMESLSSIDREKMLDELGDAVFKNPVGSWEPGSLYLSGDVKTKLAQARAAAKQQRAIRSDGKSEYDRNVTALEKIQPADVDAGDITVKLGSAWIPASVYGKFFKHITGRQGAFNHLEQDGSWTLDHNPRGTDYNIEAEESEWGISTDVQAPIEQGGGRFRIHKPAHKLIIRAMNNQDTSAKVQVRQVDGSTRTIHFPEVTSAINAKVKALQAEFERWLWEDAERVDELVATYNERFNRHTEAEFDGSHLTLPGAALEGKTIHKHVRNGIYRIITTGNTLLAHVVGAGKTWTMCGACMEMKRLGLAKKPVIVVPNHLVAQWGREFLQLYPNAKLLVASTKDFTPLRRGVLMSKIATNEWDAVIVPQTSFTRLPVSPQRIKAFFDAQLADLEADIRTAKREKGTDNRNFIAELENAKQNLQALLDKQLAKWRKDANFIPFDQLGIDAMFVDEAHDYKNLWFRTRMGRIPGISPKITQRPFDMFLKTQYINEISGGRNLVMATGTPIANSVTEAYTMQRYLQPGVLKRMGMEAFDSWASTFGRSVTELEISPEGGKFRMHTRFSRFDNLPQLKQMFRQVADVVDQKKANIKVPKVKGGKASIIDVEPSEWQRQFVKQLGARAEAVRAGDVPPEEDNMLSITNDGRKAMTDIRLIDPDLPDLPTSKVNVAVGNVLQIWKRTKKDRGVQIIWLDMGVPQVEKKKAAKKDDDDAIEYDDESQAVGRIDLYADIKKKLVAKGVPAKEIAFIHDAKNSDAAKVKLFSDVRQGKIRVLIGNTQRMGTGANIQKRLAAAHHIDAPWRPADVEQRDGRIIRWGNIYADKGGVEIYRYITKMLGSFDGYMWQTLERKATFIEQVMNDDMTITSLEDIGGTALSYAEIKAIASGDPRVMEFVQGQSALAELEAEHSSFIRSKASAAQKARDLEWWINTYRKRAEGRAALLKAVDMSAGFSVDGITYEERKDATEPIGQKIRDFADKRALDAKNLRPERIASVMGLDLWVASGPLAVELRLQRPGDDAMDDSAYRIDTGDTDVGNMTRILNGINSIESSVEEGRSKAAFAEKDRDSYLSIASKGFEKTQELTALRKKINELEAELASAASGTNTQQRAAGVVMRPDEPARTPLEIDDPTARAIRRLEQLVEAVEARQVERRQTLLYAGINPAEIRDLALWVGAHIARGTLRGYRAARRALIERHGERVRKDSDTIVRKGLEVGKNLKEQMTPKRGSKLTTKQIVRENTGQTPKPAGQKALEASLRQDQKTSAAAFRAGLDVVRAQLPGLVREAREAEKQKGKTREATINGVRDELIRIIENNLPTDQRGRYLKRVKNATSYTDLARGISSIRRQRGRYLAKLAWSSIKRHTKSAKLVKLTNERRSSIAALRAEAKVHWDALRAAKVKTSEIEQHSNRIDQIREEILTTFAEHRAENEALRLAKGLTRKVLVARSIAEAKRAKDEIQDRTNERQDIKTPILRRSGLQVSDLENITSALAGKFDDTGTLNRLLFDGLSDAHEAVDSELRDRMHDLESVARSAGFTGIEDLIQATSRRRGGKAKTKMMEVLLGGRRVSISLGNALKLAALDEETRGLIRAGTPIKLQGGLLRASITPTLREIDAITESLGVELFGLVEEGKLVRESMRPRMSAAFRRLKGYEFVQVDGYEPRKRHRKKEETKFGVEDVSTSGVRYLENMGFLKARGADTKSAIIIGDFVEDLVESITNAAKLIHLAEPIRDAAGVVTDPKLQEELTSRFGRSIPRALEDYVVAASLANEVVPSPAGRFVQVVNRWTAASKLGLNPGTWLRQLGGIPRLAAEMGAEDFAAGMKGAWGVKTATMVRHSGYFWDRMVANLSGRFSPTVGSEQVSILTPKFLTAIDTATKNIVMGDIAAGIRNLQEASLSSLQILVAFDAIIAKIAWAGYDARSRRENPDWDDATRTKWVAKQSALAVRHTQNSSSVLDMPLGGIRARDNIAGLLMLFTSDTFKARNRLVRSAHRGAKQFSAHASAEAANIIWSAAVGVGVSLVIRSMLLALGGDEDDWKQIKADALRFDKHLARVARDTLGVAVEPIFTPKIVDWFSYRTATITDVPVTSSIQDAEAAFKDMLALVKSGKAAEDPKAVLFATDAILRDGLALFGLNPLQSVWRTASKQLERQAEPKSRTRSSSRGRRDAR